MPAALTLVKDAIQRPDEPRHFMVIEPVRERVEAWVGDTRIAVSDRALLVREVGARIYDPVMYFPPGDVRGELLRPAEGSSHCPLKGTASYYDLSTPDATVVRGAWSYREVLDFDPRIAWLEGCVGFDAGTVELR